MSDMWTQEERRRLQAEALQAIRAGREEVERSDPGWMMSEICRRLNPRLSWTLEIYWRERVRQEWIVPPSTVKQQSRRRSKKVRQA